MGGRHEYALVREGACLQSWRLDRLLPGPRPADDRRVGKVGRQSPGGQAPVCHQTAPAEVTSEGLPQPRRRWPCCPQGRGRAAGRGPGRGCVVPSPCSISRACPRLRACPRVGGSSGAPAHLSGGAARAPVPTRTRVVSRHCPSGFDTPARPLPQRPVGVIRGSTAAGPRQAPSKHSRGEGSSGLHARSRLWLAKQAALGGGPS